MIEKSIDRRLLLQAITYRELARGTADRIVPAQIKEGLLAAAELLEEAAGELSRLRAQVDRMNGGET